MFFGVWFGFCFKTCRKKTCQLLDFFIFSNIFFFLKNIFNWKTYYFKLQITNKRKEKKTSTTHFTRPTGYWKPTPFATLKAYSYPPLLRGWIRWSVKYFWSSKTSFSICYHVHSFCFFFHCLLKFFPLCF